MSRRVPRGGPGPEWLNEPDDGQAHGDQGAQRNGNGAPGQDQRQYGQYAGPGYGPPAGYGQQQSHGGQGGNGYGQQGYGPQDYQPGPGQAYDNQPTQTFNYQGADPTYQGNGDPRLQRPRERRPAGTATNGDPRGYNGYQGNGDPAAMTASTAMPGATRTGACGETCAGTRTGGVSVTSATRGRGRGLVTRRFLGSRRRTSRRAGGRSGSVVPAGSSAAARSGW